MGNWFFCRISTEIPWLSMEYDGFPRIFHGNPIEYYGKISIRVPPP
jgi:hypothetical protein